jgi:hypothetical protein
MPFNIKGLCRELLRLLVIVALVFIPIGTGAARADPGWTQTSQADFESGTLFQVDTTSSPGDVKLAVDPSSEQLDQNNPHHSGKWHIIKDEDWCAQSFIAGLSGNLTKVALYLKKHSNPGQLTIEIRDTVGTNYEPGDTVYASITTGDVVSGCGSEYQFTFPSPAVVTSGTHYAIVLHEPSGVGGKGKYYWAEFQYYDIYPSGKVWLSDESGDEWSVGGCGIHDFYFRTYVSGGHYSSGTLTSSTHDTGYSADFGNISWTVTTPTSTSIEFQIATNSNNSTWNFKGPDGTPETYYTSSGTGIWAGHDNDRYIKYKAFLSTTDNSKTPALHDISITYSQPIVLPTVATGNATLVEETTATINGTLVDDGSEACQYSFEWGTASGVYTDNISWTGSINSGESFNTALSGLDEGQVYYFRARAKNSAGIGNGLELSFLTKPDEPASFSASTISDTQIDLTWAKGDGADKTMVRRKTEDYPVDRDDGVQVYFDVGTSVSDTGLSPETTYYYSAWSEVTLSGSQQWSDAYAMASATTSEAPPPPPTAVGGTVYPVNKAQVLSPWLGLFLVLSLAMGWVVFSLRKRVYSGDWPGLISRKPFRRIACFLFLLYWRPPPGQFGRNLSSPWRGISFLRGAG